MIGPLAGQSLSVLVPGPSLGRDNGHMRILVVASTQWAELGGLVADQVGAQWRSHCPDDCVRTVLLSDGGSGFVSTGSEAHAGESVFLEAQLLVQADSADTDLGLGSSYALGIELARVCSGSRNPIVLGLPPVQDEVGWADAGAGLLAGLTEGFGGTGSTGAGAGLVANRLLGGGLALGQVRPEDIPGLASLRERLGRNKLVVASRNSAPLLGLGGLAASLDDAGRLDAQAAHQLERALGDFSHTVAGALGSSLLGHNLLAGRGGEVTGDQTGDGVAVSVRARQLASAPGSAAFGGVGFMLSVLGAHLRSALEVTAEREGLDDELDRADVVLVVSPVVDASEMHDGATNLVAGRALARGVPVVVLTGESQAGRREWSALGVSSLYESVPAGSPWFGNGNGNGAESVLETLLERVPGIARTWSR